MEGWKAKGGHGLLGDSSTGREQGREPMRGASRLRGRTADDAVQGQAMRKGLGLGGRIENHAEG